MNRIYAVKNKDGWRRQLHDKSDRNYFSCKKKGTKEKLNHHRNNRRMHSRKRNKTTDTLCETLSRNTKKINARNPFLSPTSAPSSQHRQLRRLNSWTACRGPKWTAKKTKKITFIRLKKKQNVKEEGATVNPAIAAKSINTALYNVTHNQKALREFKPPTTVNKESSKNPGPGTLDPNRDPGPDRHQNLID